MSDDLLLTTEQRDRLLDALIHGREDDPPTAAEVRDFLVFAELRLRDAALVCGTINGRFAVRADGRGGWDFRLREEEAPAA